MDKENKKEETESFGKEEKNFLHMISAICLSFWGYIFTKLM